MKTFQSKITIDRPVSQVYSFLTDLNNHRQLMPDNITDWVSTNDTAGFNVQNMAKLNLKAESRITDKLVTIIPSEKPPFDLELKWELFSADDHTGVVYTISADLNMMMKMLASGPLQKLADHETQTLKNLLS
jgi:carbon monoxide dehydrogenase subunit G